MGYDHGDSFPFDFQPNGIQFGSNREENCHHDHIPFNLKGNRIRVFSVFTVCLISLLSAARVPDRLNVRHISLDYLFPVWKQLKHHDTMVLRG